MVSLSFSTSIELNLSVLPYLASRTELTFSSFVSRSFSPGPTERSTFVRLKPSSRRNDPRTSPRVWRRGRTSRRESSPRGTRRASRRTLDLREVGSRGRRARSTLAVRRVLVEEEVGRVRVDLRLDFISPGIQFLCFRESCVFQKAEGREVDCDRNRKGSSSSPTFLPSNSQHPFLRLSHHSAHATKTKMNSFLPLTDEELATCKAFQAHDFDGDEEFQVSSSSHLFPSLPFPSAGLIIPSFD